MWDALGHILIYEGKWVKVEVRLLVFVEISVEVVDVVIVGCPGTPHMGEVGVMLESRACLVILSTVLNCVVNPAV